MTSSPHASQYPAPPDGQDPHNYTPLYPNGQVLDGQAPSSRIAYPQEAAYPKLENINEVLQAQQALQANHALNPPLPQQSKPNRLRKACDSCSIRKVKVGAFSHNTMIDTDVCSATNRARRVELASRWRFHVPLSARADDADRPIGMPKRSRSAG